MTEIIKLRSSSIKNVPLQNYSNDFKFIVNGKEYETCRLVSELLSPNICKIHSIDPTLDVFTINTTQEGDFTKILNLIKFDEISFTEKELPFLFEVFEILGNESLKFRYLNPNIEITNDNVLKLIQKQLICEKYYEDNIYKEIEYASTHFFEICENYIEDFKKLPPEIIDNITNNQQLILESEDQLMKFANSLYSFNSKYSFLYENVFFENVSIELIKEFALIFDQSDLSRITWLSLLSRLQNDGKKCDSIPFKRYKRESQIFNVNKDEIFKGIIYHLQTKPNETIDENLKITASSVLDNQQRNQPRNVILYDDLGRRFYSGRQKNCWICFDFLNNRVAPTNYTIRSIPWRQNCCHPKSWVIEGSNDQLIWDKLDEKINCPLLNGSSIVQTFDMKNVAMKEYRFIRMRMTNTNWSGNSYFAIESFEIYGALYPK